MTSQHQILALFGLGFLELIIVASFIALLVILLGGGGFFIFALVKAIKTKKVGWIITTVIIPVILVGLFAIVFAMALPIIVNARKKATFAHDGQFIEETVMSPDGRLSLRVPRSWKAMPDLNDVASLQVGNKQQDVYTIVIEDARADLDAGETLEILSQKTAQGIMGNLKDGKTTANPDTMIGKWPAKCSRIEGRLADAPMLKIVYHHTTLMTDTAFYQILQWSKAADEQTARPLFEKIAQTFTAQPLLPEQMMENSVPTPDATPESTPEAKTELKAEPGEIMEEEKTTPQ